MKKLTLLLLVGLLGLGSVACMEREEEVYETEPEVIEQPADVKEYNAEVEVEDGMMEPGYEAEEDYEVEVEEVE